MVQKLVVLELNEVPDIVIDRFVETHPDSSFGRLFARSARYRVATPDTIQLHPKLSWQTFHRGVPDHEHGYLEYNQLDAPGYPDRPPLWSLLQQAGRRIGCGASIGSWPLPEGNETLGVDFYLPDPFASGHETIPPRLEVFQRFNTRAVQQSGRNVRTGGLVASDALRLIFNLPRLGVTTKTCLAIAAQLVNERRHPQRVVRRRNVQGRLSFDVAFNEVRRHQPDFATLFVNHVAAAMHRYWAAAFPDDYDDMRMPASWRSTYNDEIFAAMRDADYMLGRLDGFLQSHPDYRLLVLGTMGQEAVPHEVVENQLIIKDFDTFMSALGFTATDYRKLAGMEPEYNVSFQNNSLLERFEHRCESMFIGNETPYVKRVNNVQASIQVFQNNVSFEHVGLDGHTVPLGNVGLHVEPIQDMSGSTAQHTRTGCCFVVDGCEDLSGWSDARTRHDLVQVTASILTAQGVQPPPYMRDPIPKLVRVLGGNLPESSRSDVSRQAVEQESQSFV